MKFKSILKMIVLTATSAALLLQSEWIPALAVGKNAEINEANILELLDGYDPDGAYIIRSSIERGDDYLAWFDENSTIIADISIAVHEETHRYILQNHNANEEEIYVGSGQGIHVEYTEVFDSSEMSSVIPEELRTFRFDTYVGKPDENMASDIHGVYGLMNEFTAYCWDLNNTVCLYDYYKTEANTAEDWLSYINLYANGRMAYSEFNFYILHYLKYAQENYPQIYSDIAENENLVKAYLTIENKFRSLIETAEQYIDEIIQENNGEIREDSIFFGSDGIGIYSEEYNRLIDETSKNEYQEIYSSLAKKLPNQPSATSSTSVTSGKSALTTTTTAASIAKTTAPKASTTISYNNILLSVGSGEEEDKSWLSVSNIVLFILWFALALSLIVIIVEVLKNKNK